MDKRKVLLLCTGNSCRSQIAEAIINFKAGEKWQAYSAGTEPAGYVHPKAIAALEEIGIFHKGISKKIDDLPTRAFDLVITVCDDAAENCPAWLREGNKVHIRFLDPAKASGTEEEILSVFRNVRKEIEDRILGYLEKILI
ncbi:MAG: arsenate reductase ArsC [Chloroflexi bacterium]|jgi:arsenate reductase (thioredoxin)|nr:arsenate reductase ArsC [Chloroflexota bacterium]MBT3670172.1 arsenate reductase ArsC [Chloroflexota bacterium]MBT4004042.1 arsenate reductase ArsC [Chloroflexota bacterium]MBT4306154.1 arsenate reductase ArsC [Chloroflexota bacterium]MBT4534534.1 arsenate reductase ArsC [Chloroflexota bacterium]